jgi:hypothetical protein
MRGWYRRGFAPYLPLYNRGGAKKEKSMNKKEVDSIMLNADIISSAYGEITDDDLRIVAEITEEPFDFPILAVWYTAILARIAPLLRRGALKRQPVPFFQYGWGDGRRSYAEIPVLAIEYDTVRLAGRVASLLPQDASDLITSEAELPDEKEMFLEDFKKLELVLARTSDGLKKIIQDAILLGQK